MNGKFLVVAAVAALPAANSVARGQSPTSAVRTEVDYWISTTEREFVGLADAMPPEKFDFALPRAIGEFAGVRTFGAQVKHVAANNYGMATLIRGERRPSETANETGPDSVRTREQVLAYLRGSFRALHEAVATIDDANAAAAVALPGTSLKTRLSCAIDAVAHSYDHYGQLVVYLRMNGIVPPASRK
jgi:hypothetical protein